MLSKMEKGKKRILVTKTKDGKKTPIKKFKKNEKEDSKKSAKPSLVKPDGKQDWSKLKSEKKQLKLQRKKSKSTYEVSVEAKKIYEKLLCKKTDLKTKQTLAADLYSLVKEKEFLKKFIMAHDTARIIQCLFKYAPDAIKEHIAEALLDVSTQMATSKYSQYCIMRIFKYGNGAIRDKFINSFYGKIVKLTSHTISSGIIDTAYLMWASTEQKAFMKQEFFGDLYKKDKDKSVKILSDAYKDSKELKKPILEAVKANLAHVANKKLVDNSLVHSVLLEYLQECDGAQKDEIIALYSPLIPSLITTKDGCRAAIICFWNSATKERRAIVKSVKEHIVKICTHEQGYVLLLAIVNSLDDTKATKKALFDPIYSNLDEIMNNQWGRKVVEWFIAPADTECFHPSLISFLNEGLEYSKKDTAVRRKEILEQIEEPLCSKICENPLFWMEDGHKGLVTATILKNVSDENYARTVDSIAKLICDPDWKVQTEVKKSNDKEKHALIQGIEDSGLHIVLKKMLKQEKEREVQTLGAAIIENISSEMTKEWIQLNRGCFILLNIYENTSNETKTKIKEMLKKHVSILKGQQHTGARLLIEKLDFKK